MVPPISTTLKYLSEGRLEAAASGSALYQLWKLLGREQDFRACVLLPEGLFARRLPT
jgi:hypothetical protein